MSGWIRNIVVTILVASIALAIWKYFGGDLGSFFSTVWTIFYGIVDSVSNVGVQIINGVNSWINGS